MTSSHWQVQLIFYAYHQILCNVKPSKVGHLITKNANVNDLGYFYNAK